MDKHSPAPEEKSKLRNEINASEDKQSDTQSHNLTQIDPSLVEYLGFDQNYCGYCKLDEKQIEGRKSVGMRAKRLLPADYQELMDLGWRRSGTYCYHPINNMTCCPNYSLYCKASEFKPSKSQRRCITNLNSYLVNDNISEKVNLCHARQDCDDWIEQSSNLTIFNELKKSSKARDRRFVASCERKVRLYNISIEQAMKTIKRKNINRRRKEVSLEDLLYPKAHESPDHNTHSLRTKHQLEINLLYVGSQECKASRADENEIIKRYQKEVHKEDESEWTMSRFCCFLVDTPIVVERVKNLDPAPDDCDDTLTQDVRSDDKFLLVKPPKLPTSYGTYHCMYLLDGKLIAVGVLDVLPKCVTTVYFFYDPEYGFLNLGIYSALVEISLVRQLITHFKKEAELFYYHLGYYVHECKKMHYKTKFHPSYLLCSETKQYVPTEICLKKLTRQKYSRFSDETVPNFGDSFCYSRVEKAFKIPVKTPVTTTSRMMDYIDWIRSELGAELARKILDFFVLQYLRHVGPDLATRMILEFSVIHRWMVDVHTNSP